MAQKKPVVEIIPWHHSAGCQSHADVVEYIRKLPKNSHLALELAPGALAYVGKVEDRLSGRSPSLRGLSREGKVFFRGISGLKPAHFVNMPRDSLAGYEVLHECRKRNITVIPLETWVSEATYSDLGFGNLLRMKKSEEGMRFREETHARQIQLRLMKFSGEKLPAIVGGVHALGLKTNLEKLGITATVNTGLFTYQHLVELKMELIAKLRKAMNAGKLREAESTSNVIRRIDAEEPIRAESPPIIALRIFVELRAKAARPERKLAERKQKLAVRLARQQRRK